MRKRWWVSLSVLSVSAAMTGLSGCGESASSAPSAAASPAPSPAPTEAKPKTKAKKGVNPTADMDRDELRAYRKQQKEQGKAD